MTDDNKLLSADSQECQYLEKAMEYWKNQSSTDKQPADGNLKYEVLEIIVEEEIQTRTSQLVSYFCLNLSFLQIACLLVAFKIEKAFTPR